MLPVPDGEFGLRSVYEEYGGIPPFKEENTWRVTELEPMRYQAHVGDDGSMTFALTIELEAIDTGTHLTQSPEMTPRWTGRLATRSESPTPAREVPSHSGRSRDSGDWR